MKKLLSILIVIVAILWFNFPLSESLPHSHGSASVDTNRSAILTYLKMQRGGFLPPVLAITGHKSNPNEPMHPALAEADLFEEDRRVLNILLHRMPECYAGLQYFYPRYERQQNKGLASAHAMIIDMTWPIEVVKAIIVHECGHIVDLGYFEGTADSGRSNFHDNGEIMYNNDPSVAFYNLSWTDWETLKPDAVFDDFCSRYGHATDIFEDFATCYSLYNTQRVAFYERALENDILMQKYVWFASHFNNPPVANGLWRFSGIVPWDETKLAVEWEF